jgi:4-hydroxybenzoate polyprenyltransferase
MKVIRTALSEVVGLFVEDGSLAILLLLWIGVAAYVFPRWPGGAALHGPFFCLGVTIILLENVWRSARHARRTSAELSG